MRKTQCMLCDLWIVMTNEGMQYHSNHFHGRIDSYWVNQ